MTSPAIPMRVLIYSDDAAVREKVRLALGRRPAPDVPPVEIVEVATDPAVVAAVDEGSVDVLVLDGEAWPAGGMGICRQLKEEIEDCPPMLVLTARRDDAWLAAWSRADAVLPQPVDPIRLAEAVADLQRQRAAGIPVQR
jgi:DNA-binding NarL/FixJ family response regulator